MIEYLKQSKITWAGMVVLLAGMLAGSLPSRDENSGGQRGHDGYPPDDAFTPRYRKRFFM
ncbi:MAG: hypothetical protein VR69_00355 [Peptococcaceae bacterium BRH_c4b]|nr:MAG: hypothetical protein VR69_00355 [Peptococcaceae bacterium BRH_c4b]